MKTARLFEVTLALVLARVRRPDLDTLLRTSRALRAAARDEAALRCRQARSVFDALVRELSRRLPGAASVDAAPPCSVYVRHQYEELREGQKVFSASIRMRIRLMADRIDIEVVEERDVAAVVIVGDYAPIRTDAITVTPGENMIEPNFNGYVYPSHPMPGDLCAYVCAALVGEAGGLSRSLSPNQSQ